MFVCNLKQVSMASVLSTFANTYVVLIIIFSNKFDKICYRIKSGISYLFAMIRFNVDKSIAFTIIILKTLT